MRDWGLLLRVHVIEAGLVRSDTEAGEQAALADATGRSRIGVITAVLPGIGFGAVATSAAMAINHLLPAVSPLLIAIVFGALVANTVGLSARVKPGLSFASKQLLRIGVALLGLQLVIGDILALGWGVVAVVVAIVTMGIVGTMFVGRLLGLSWTQRLLIACGFSICGAAAVAAVDGVVKADEEDTLSAIALVVIFGTLMIPLVPLTSAMIGLSEVRAGMWAGGSIHEVAQAVAAGGAIGGAALGVATVVKLARVLMLAPVLAILSVQQRRAASGAATTKRPPLVPMFVAGFIACVVVRSTGLLPNTFIAHGQVVQTALLTVAMFALGTGVQLAMLRKVGVRPFLVATVSTAWIATVALIGVVLI
jgi:uncharacterized integral membrane protein (TIGR00698 family)